MHPPRPGPERVFVLRHGESTANVRGLIASSPAHAESAFGLTAEGRAQVLRGVTEARAAGLLDAAVRVISSPLLRARETAEVAAAVLAAEVEIDGRLIERGFGALELGPDEGYRAVWAADREDPSHERDGVESVTAIVARVTGLLRDLEAAAESRTVLLCTHGDVASVLLCLAQGLPVGLHRDVGALANGEIRPLEVSSLRP